MSPVSAAAPQDAGRLEPETPADAAAIETLVLAAFGPGRFAKTAERLREGSRPVAGFVIRDQGRVVGSVRLWPVAVGDGRAVFLGPIAVDAAVRSTGFGAALVRACVDSAREMGVAGVLLVGDPVYFQRFGFVSSRQVQMPGPVDPNRVMWLSLGAEAPIGRATRA